MGSARVARSSRPVSRFLCQDRWLLICCLHPPSAALALNYWNMHLTYGWNNQDTSSSYCARWGACTGERSVRYPAYTHARTASGKSPLHLEVLESPGLTVRLRNGRSFRQRNSIGERHFFRGHVSERRSEWGLHWLGTVNLSAPAPAGGAVVLLSCDSGVASVPASVTVPAGAETVTFSVLAGAVSTLVRITIPGLIRWKIPHRWPSGSHRQTRIHLWSLGGVWRRRRVRRSRTHLAMGIQAF